MWFVILNLAFLENFQAMRKFTEMSEKGKTRSEGNRGDVTTSVQHSFLQKSRYTSSFQKVKK
jgi:hypothetical protein